MNECKGTRGALRDIPDLGMQAPQRSENALGANQKRRFQASMQKKRGSVLGRQPNFVIFEETCAHGRVRQPSSDLFGSRVLERRKDCSRKLTLTNNETSTYTPSSIFIPDISNLNQNAAPGHRTRNKEIDHPIQQKTRATLKQMNLHSGTPGSKTLISTPRTPDIDVHRNAKTVVAIEQRIPLKSSAKVMQSSTFTVDRPGLPTGKENICPSTHCGLQFDPNWPGYTSESRHCARAISAPQNLQKASRVPLNRNAGAKKDTFNDNILPYDRSLYVSPKSTVRAASQPHSAQSKRPDRTMSEGQKLNESWLATQEVSITATLNRLFSNTRDQRPANGSTHLARELATLLKQPRLVQLHQRLEASLQFGSLALPKGDSPAARLQSDIAIRSQFIDLWVGAYKHKILSAAIEAIAGHGLTDQYSLSSLKSQSRASVETFLLSHEDVGQRDQESKGAPLVTSSWQRTIGRSLMIILLLDRARQAGIIDVPIFNRHSRFKSSRAVLLGLDSLLRPSWSNVGRALTHLEYHLDHTQHPLAEFDYTVRNLAVDLRDGVRLTRLTEVLFGETIVDPTSESVPTSRQAEKPSSGEIKNTTSPLRLSQKLRYPSSGKAAKLQNVQIALNVITEFDCISAFPRDITAMDIVEGHREWTLLLLWFLLHEKAFCSLIDRSDLMNEIVRLNLEFSQNPNYASDSTKAPLLSEYHRESNLLELWAIAVARKHGLNTDIVAENITESSLIDTLVNEYWFYIFPGQSLRPQSLHLQDKLNRLGFSKACGK